MMFGLWSATDSAPSAVCYCKRTQLPRGWRTEEQRNITQWGFRCHGWGL